MAKPGVARRLLQAIYVRTGLQTILWTCAPLWAYRCVSVQDKMAAWMDGMV